jgi:hypothetical protein
VRRALVVVMVLATVVPAATASEAVPSGTTSIVNSGTGIPLDGNNTSNWVWDRTSTGTPTGVGYLSFGGGYRTLPDLEVARTETKFLVCPNFVPAVITTWKGSKSAAAFSKKLRISLKCLYPESNGEDDSLYSTNKFLSLVEAQELPLLRVDVQIGQEKASLYRVSESNPYIDQRIDSRYQRRDMLRFYRKDDSVAFFVAGQLLVGRGPCVVRLVNELVKDSTRWARSYLRAMAEADPTGNGNPYVADSSTYPNSCGLPDLPILGSAEIK